MPVAKIIEARGVIPFNLLLLVRPAWLETKPRSFIRCSWSCCDLNYPPIGRQIAEQLTSSLSLEEAFLAVSVKACEGVILEMHLESSRLETQRADHEIHQSAAVISPVDLG